MEFGPSTTVRDESYDQDRAHELESVELIQQEERQTDRTRPTPSHADDPPNEMQRSASRNAPFAALTGNSGGSLFTAKNGTIDKQKTFLVLVCSALFLYLFYDLCCHYHSVSYADAVEEVRSQQRVAVGDAAAVGSVLRAPGSPNGELPASDMFRYTDSQKSSFLNNAGVIAFPVQADHQVKKQVNGLHVATILPGQTRGNHMHHHHSEVLELIHGHFLLRVAKIGNDGQWSSADFIFEIGLPSNPFANTASVVSSTPIGIELPPNVCHALRNLDPSVTAFFTSYYVLDQDAKRQEPDRETCRNQPKAFLK